MAQKWNLQDIVPPDRGGERTRQTRRASDMRPPTKSRGTAGGDIRPSTRPVASADHEEETGDDVNRRVRRDSGNASRIKRYGFIAATVVFFGLVVFGVTVLLGGAEVTVYPKNKNVNVQTTLTAKQQPRAGELGYELLSLEEEGERRVSANGQEDVSLRAEGTITVVNEFSTSPQRLIKNTRFESPEGMIYRIADSIVVPGLTKNDAGETIPGKIEASVFADGPGETYNITGKVRLTIPGLKGTEQYETMYGESAPGNVKGGFEGTRFVIDDNELSVARQELQKELRDKLLARVASEKPAGFVLYESAITFVFDSLPATEAGDKVALIKEQARLRVPLFDEKGFASYLAKNTISEYDGAAVRMENPTALTFSYPATPNDIAASQEISFNLSGNTRIIWTFDPATLTKDLSGVAKAGLPTVLSGYPAIERAEAVIRPFWRQSFPEDPSEIKVTEIVAVE